MIKRINFIELCSKIYIGISPKKIKNQYEIFLKKMENIILSKLPDINLNYLCGRIFSIREFENFYFILLEFQKIEIKYKNIKNDVFMIGEFILVTGEFQGSYFFGEIIYNDCRNYKINTFPSSLDINIMICIGPFLYKGIHEIQLINEKIKESKTQINIFLGPIINFDSNLLIGKSCINTSYELYQDIIRMISQEIPHCFFIPSMLDSYSIPIFPTPKIPITVENCLFVNDPSFLRINGVNLLLSSFDLTSFFNDNEKNDILYKKIIHQSFLFPFFDGRIQKNYLSDLILNYHPNIIIIPSVETNLICIENCNILSIFRNYKFPTIINLKISNNKISYEKMNLCN